MPKVRVLQGSPSVISCKFSISPFRIRVPSGGTLPAKRRKDWRISARSLKKSRWSSSIFNIRAYLG